MKLTFNSVFTFRGHNNVNPDSLFFSNNILNKNIEPQKNNKGPDWKKKLLVIGILAICIVAGSYYTWSKYSSNSIAVVDEQTNVDIKWTSNGIKIICNSDDWDKISKQIEELFQKEQTEIHKLIRKAKTGQLSLSEATLLFGWLQKNYDNLPDELKALYERLQGGRIELYIVIINYLNSLKQTNKTSFDINFCFNDGWIIESYTINHKHFLYYLSSVTISLDGVIMSTYRYGDMIVENNTRCLSVVMSNQDGVWNAQFHLEQDMTDIPDNDLLEVFFKENPFKIYRPFDPKMN